MSHSSNGSSSNEIAPCQNILSGKFNPLIFRSVVIHRKYWETKTTFGKVVTEEKRKIFVKITVNHRKKRKTKTPFC